MEDLWLYLAIFTAFYLITKHFFRKPQNLPPSPFPALPILGHLHLISQPIHRNLARLAAQEGPVLYLRLGVRRVLLLSSSAAAEECLHKSDAAFSNRPSLVFGEILGYNNTIFLFAPYGDLWRSLRRMSTTEILSPHRLHMLSGIRADEVKSLLVRINSQISPTEGEGGRTAHMQSLLFETVNNVMLRMIAGKRYYGEKEVTVEARTFRDLVVELKKLGSILSIEDFFPVLRRFTTGRQKRLRGVFRRIDEFFQELLDQHRRRRRRKMESGISERNGTSDGSLIAVMLSLQEKDPNFFSDEIIKGQALLMLMAGADTSLGTMEWALSLLLNHPTILRKAQLEIDEIVGQHRQIKESDLDFLPYLHCIITETLRMYPVVPMFLHNSSRACGIDRYEVNADTWVMVNLWAIQNDPKLWDEPTEFKPERFTGLDGHRSGFKLMPFGAGRRGCPGEALAIKMVGLVLGSILQCFDLERAGERLVDMDETIELTLARANPLIAKCRPRVDMIKLLSV